MIDSVKPKEVASLALVVVGCERMQLLAPNQFYRVTNCSRSTMIAKRK